MAETNGEQSESLPGICEIRVQGFKSLVDSGPVAIRPLTILAGANSSGKSSLMQPLLLMKQTLNAPFDPGPLRPDGGNVYFSHADELLTRCAPASDSFGCSVRLGTREGFEVRFARTADNWVNIERCTHYYSGVMGTIWPELTLEPNLSHDELERRFPGLTRFLSAGPAESAGYSVTRLAVERLRCVLVVETTGMFGRGGQQPEQALSHVPAGANEVATILHLPGLRGEPLRRYPYYRGARIYEGRFHEYLATVLLQWTEHDQDRLGQISKWCEALSLGERVAARQVAATDVELLIRMAGLDEPVNLADVGFGVSQVLPVLVALLAAEPGQLVYLEQPELHLHPRAQVALAGPLVEAAKRGVRVVAETHSDLLLLAVQTAVAKGEIAPDQVMLHWFERDDEGVSHVTSQEPDETGAFQNWPVDFGAVRIQAERELIAAGWE